MKNLFNIIILCTALGLNAQSPVEYMQKINKNTEQIMQNNWKYLSAIARSNSPSKVANMKRNLESSLKESLRNLNAAGSFNGNDDYRKASMDYQKFSLDLITGQTSKLVDLEKISQNSFDNFEAYIMYRRQLNERSEQEAQKINQAQKQFAQENNVNLVQGENKLIQKIEEGGKVLSYQEDLMLVYMRSAMYEMDMLSRIETNEPYNFTQAGITLLDLVDTSRNSLNQIQDINSDKSLRLTVENALNLFEEEAETLIPVLTEFKKSVNDLEKAQKEIENMPAQNRTKALMDDFNTQVETTNKLSENFSNLLNEYNHKRTKVFNDWNTVSAQFIDKYMPAE